MLYIYLIIKNDSISMQHYNMTIQKVCDNCHILYTVPHNIVMKTCAICNSKIKCSKKIIVVLVPDYDQPFYFNHGITLDDIRSALKVEGGYITSTTKIIPGCEDAIMRPDCILDEDIYKFIPPPVERTCLDYWSELLCIACCTCSTTPPDRYRNNIVYKYPEYP